MRILSIDDSRATRQFIRCAVEAMDGELLEAAHALAGNRETCRAAGMNEYIPEPVTAQSLVDSVKKWYTSPGESI